MENGIFSEFFLCGFFVTLLIRMAETVPGRVLWLARVTGLAGTPNLTFREIAAGFRIEPRAIWLMVGA